MLTASQELAGSNVFDLPLIAFNPETSILASNTTRFAPDHFRSSIIHLELNLRASNFSLPPYAFSLQFLL